MIGILGGGVGQVGAHFRVVYGSLYTLSPPSRPTLGWQGIVLATPLSLVAALSLHLTVWPIFLWVQAANKEIEAIRNEKGKCPQPEREKVVTAVSLSQAFSLTTYQCFAWDSPRTTDSLLWVLSLPALLPGPAVQRPKAVSSGAAPWAQKFSVLHKVAAVRRGCYSQTLQVSQRTGWISLCLKCHGTNSSIRFWGAGQGKEDTHQDSEGVGSSPSFSLDFLGDPGQFICPISNNVHDTPALYWELCLVSGHLGINKTTSALRTSVT